VNPWLKASAISFFSYYELKFVVVVVAIVVITVVVVATAGAGAAVVIILFPSIRLQNLLYIRWTPLNGIKYLCIMKCSFVQYLQLYSVD